jgi:ethanolamine utilization protein EutQ
MEIDEKTLSEVIAKIVEATIKAEACSNIKSSVDEFGTVKEVAPSGVTKLDYRNTKLPVFDCNGVHQDGVFMADISGVDDDKNLGAGVMSIDHSALEWTLTYDEMDIVLEGTLQIETNGDIVEAHPGEMIIIPKNSHIHFQSPSTCKYLYVVYPTNWTDYL